MTDSSSPIDHLQTAVRRIEPKRGLPPVEDWRPAREGEIDIRIGRDGRWWYRGSPIERAAMVRLFSTILRKDADGETYLVTPAEKLRIQVDDAHFLVTGLEVEGEGRRQRLHFSTQTGDRVVADAAHPLWVVVNPATGEPAPYLRVRGRLDGLLTRALYYRLVDAAQPETGPSGTELVVYSAGERFVLGSVAGD